jgi:hypothetical protein
MASRTPRRTGLALAGLALAGGAMIGFASPAQAAAPAANHSTAARAGGGDGNGNGNGPDRNNPNSDWGNPESDRNGRQGEVVGYYRSSDECQQAGTTGGYGGQSDRGRWRIYRCDPTQDDRGSGRGSGHGHDTWELRVWR